jgi:hypothetical protein
MGIRKVQYPTQGMMVSPYEELLPFQIGTEL